MAANLIEELEVRHGAMKVSELTELLGLDDKHCEFSGFPRFVSLPISQRTVTSRLIFQRKTRDEDASFVSPPPRDFPTRYG